MKNKIAGLLVIGIAILIGFIIFSFNMALTEIVNTSCAHGPACPMWGSINFQTNVSIGVLIFIVLIGLYLIFFGKEEKTLTKIRMFNPKLRPEKISIKSYEKILKALSGHEKNTLKKIIQNQGSLSQSDLIKSMNLGKVKVTRILDRLEGRGLIERKRRGMSNVVILKH